MNLALSADSAEIADNLKIASEFNARAEQYTLNAGTTFLALEIALGTLVVVPRGILQGSEFTCDASFMLFICLVLCTSTLGAAGFNPSAYSMSGALLPANVPKSQLDSLRYDGSNSHGRRIARK